MSFAMDTLSLVMFPEKLLMVPSLILKRVIWTTNYHSIQRLWSAYYARNWAQYIASAVI